MSLLLHWSGKAYTKNKKGSYNSKTGGHYKNHGYQAFQDGMVLMFRSQAKGRTFTHPDVMVITCLGRSMDHHNLVEPVMDALQMSGVIGNDRDVGWVSCAPPTRHERGKDDIIEILLTGV